MCNINLHLDISIYFSFIVAKVLTLECCVYLENNRNSKININLAHCAMINANVLLYMKHNLSIKGFIVYRFN